MNSEFIANLHVESGGSTSGPTILLLHGVTRQIADLAPVIERLPREYGWIAVDFPGHGQSPKLDGEYKVRDYSDAIARLLDSIDRSPLIIFGHSLGAMVAAKVASNCPQRIVGAILEDPPFSTMGSRIKESTFYLQFQGVRELLRSLPDARMLYEKLRDLPVRRPIDGQTVRFCEVRDDLAIRTYARYLSKVDPRVLDSIVTAEWLDGYDFQAIAAKIAAPVLLLQADMKVGGMLTDDEAKLFSEAAADCRLKTFDGASHLIHATHADALAQEIDRFLQSIFPTLA